jgi:hypothetical protein
MQKNIEDYLPCYIGQDMIFTHSDGRRSEPAKLNGFISASKNYEAEAHFFRDRYGMKELEKSNWRLGLRPLSSMTREEAEFVNCGSIMSDEELKEYGYYNELSDGCPAYQYLRHEDYGSVQTLADAIGNPVTWHYLLKQGFDLFGLIEANLAVDKTKEVTNGND